MYTNLRNDIIPLLRLKSYTSDRLRTHHQSVDFLLSSSYSIAESPHFAGSEIIPANSAVIF